VAQRPRMDPANVLWFFGAIATQFGVYALIESVPSGQDGLCRLLTAVGFFLAIALAAGLLLRQSWWVPGGLAAALVVGTFPSVAVGFMQLIGVWHGDTFFGPFDHFSGYWFGVALATAIVGVATYVLTRFTFVLAVAIGFFIVASQLFVPCYDEGPDGDVRAVMALVVGAALVIAGVFFDIFARRREAFWLHVFGLLTVAGGLIWFTADPDGDPNRGWVPMLIAALVLLIAAGPIRRATWAVYGVLGVYAATTHYLSKGLNEQAWAFALSVLLLGLAIFAAGMLVQRYGKTCAKRFVRRPPPTIKV
jgi:hypothetical protein